MSKSSKTKGELRGKARLRAEIVEMTQALHKVGAVSDQELDMTTLKMLGKDALPKVEAMPPAEIVKVRQEAKVSQAVLAALMNVAVSTVSQWERGERRPSGAALKLLHVVKRGGIGVLR
ncbi:MAG: helix-turn-helix domain-containing protein [Rhodomicrobium sp.]